MASEDQVKSYLAYWFQLGKKVLLDNGRETLYPQPLFEGNRYSQDFENCWQRILLAQGDCYLEGTEQSIQQLLTPAWEIVGCARCSMPVPISVVGRQSLICPCFDLSSWPNVELPLPRDPVDNQKHLSDIHQRLLNYDK
jgi:hypothetical protein